MARKTYSEQFKGDAIKLLASQGYSLRKASKAMGVSQATLCAWKKTLVPREQRDWEAKNRRLRRVPLLWPAAAGLVPATHRQSRQTCPSPLGAQVQPADTPAAPHA